MDRGLSEHHYENAIRTKSGEQRLVRWSNTVLTEDGRFKMVLSIGEDITDQRRTEEERARLVQRLTVLHRVSQEIIRASADSEQVYTTIHQAVAELMPAEALVISLRTGKTSADSVYLVDEAGRHPPQRVPLGDGLTWRVLSTEDSVLISDASRGVPFRERRFGSEKTVRSILAVPLRIGSEVMGMLSAQSYRPGVYSEGDLAILEMLAAHAAAAIENARLLERLWEEEERFRSLYENTAIGLYRTTPDGRIVMANPALVRMLGYSSFQELAQRDLTAEGYEPGYPRRDFQERIARDGQVLGIESAWKRKDGSTLSVRENARLIRDEAGRPLYYDGTVEDVTPLLEVERVRQQQERLLTIAGQMASLGGWYVDLATDRVVWSDEVAAIHEMPPGFHPSVEEAIAFYAPECQARIAEVFAACATEGIPYDEELQIITRSGRRVWVHAIGEPFRDASSRIVGVEGAFQDITERRLAEEELRESYAKVRRMFDDIVNVLASTIELRDPYTAGHQRRVAELVAALGSELGLPTDELNGLRIAGLVHDVGKVVVPAEILSKPGQLSELEMYLVRAHPEAGFNVLRGIKFPWPVAEIVYQHHERLDGSGYPRGLNGDAILFGARVLAVADVVEAMSSHRPYRPALGIEAALAEIEAGKGQLYDPQVVDACASLFRKGFAFDEGEGRQSQL